MKKKRNILSVFITLLIGFVIYFVELPPINVTSFEFWFFVLTLLAIYLFLTTVSKISVKGIDFNLKKMKYLIITIISIPIFIVITNILLSPLFNSKAFSERITVNEDTEESNFISEIKEVDFNSLALLDKDSSSRLGDRVMGQMPELVSQFYVSSLYTQINYNNEIVRVTPLEYNGLF